MKLKPNTIYHCKTPEASEAFLQDCDAQGITWEDGETASSYDGFDEYDDDTCYYVFVSDNKLCIAYGDIDDYCESYPNTPVVVYSAITDEELAAMDAAWKAMMQSAEPPK